MNGLVAIVSRDPSVRGRGPEALGVIGGCVREAPGTCALGPVALSVCGPALLGDLAVQEADPDGRRPALAAAVSGEIVNGSAVARELGLDTAEVSPARLALAAYGRWGARLFVHLEGIYAIVLRDESADLTLAGVDPRHIGYVVAAQLGDDVWFASEAKVLRADARFAVRMDAEAAMGLLTEGDIPSGGSLFAGVVGLPMGFHFELRGGTLTRVRHDDDRDLCGGTLRGEAYLDRLEETMAELAAEAFAGGRIALPLTGGLDARLLAAVTPEDLPPLTFTFGGAHDDDVVAARRIAAARGLDHRLFPLDADFLATSAALTVHVAEGRLSPAVNVTGALMGCIGDCRAFVSGQGGELGRRFMTTVGLVPDRALLTARPDEFVELAVRRHYHPTLGEDHLRTLVGGEAVAYAAVGRGWERRTFEASAGLHNVDRLDLYAHALSFWESRPQLLFNRVAVGVRAPYHTRRWAAAVLAGHPSERIDDVTRLRLIRRLDASVAAVPWVLTHLSLPASERLLLGLRRAALLEPLAARLPQPLRAAPLAAARNAKRRLYRHGEQRDEWLRMGSAYLEQVLLAPRALERGPFREAGVRRLLDEHMAGADHTRPLGQLLNLELWQREFVDGDPAPSPPQVPV